MSRRFRKELDSLPPIWMWSTDVHVLLLGSAIDRQQRQTCHRVSFVSAVARACQVGVCRGVEGRKEGSNIFLCFFFLVLCCFVRESKAENTAQTLSCSRVAYCKGSAHQGETKKILHDKVELFLRLWIGIQNTSLLESRTQRTLQLLLLGLYRWRLLPLLSGPFEFSFLGQDLHIAAVAQVICDY